MNKNMKLAPSEIAILVEQCRQENAQAQMRLYRFFAPRVFSSALRILGSESEAEDAMQEAFSKAFSKIQTYDGKGPFEGWLRRIVINEAITAHRKRKVRRYVPLDGHEMNESHMQTQTQVEKMMVFEKVKQALSNLKENYRMALTLFLIEEYDYKEIGHCLNISYANSRTLISRAKAALRNELEKL